MQCFTMKKKLTKEQIRELIWIDYEEFLEDFQGLMNNSSKSENDRILDEIRITNFLLYTLLKEIAK